jgi:hypothetical protein
VDPLIVKAVCTGFGGLLLLAARHKLVILQQFRAVLADYRVLPVPLVTPVAWTVPAIELLIGSSWLLACAGYLPVTVAALATTLLLALYTLAMAINLLRGRRHISCGCGLASSATDGQLLSWWLIARNGVLIGVALAAGLPLSARVLNFGDYATLAALLLSAALLYIAAAQLLRNRAAIAAWRQGHD